MEESDDLLAVASRESRRGRAGGTGRHPLAARHRGGERPGLQPGPRAVTVRGRAKVKAVVLWFILAHNLLRSAVLRAARAGAA